MIGLLVGFGLVLAGVALTVIGLIIHALVSKEAVGWVPVITGTMLRHAAERLPEAERPRWSEEWDGELSTMTDRPLSMLMYAAGVAWHSRALRRELEPRMELARLPATRR